MRSQLPNHHTTILRMVAEGKPTGAIGDAVGCTAETVRRYLERHGLKAKRPNQKGESNHNWGGGRTVDKHGYVLVKCDGHPGENSHGYVREHRLVMEKRLGRYLTDDEVVDHKNGDTGDNRDGNLVLYACNADHLRATITGKPHNMSAANRAKLSRLVAVRNVSRARLNRTDAPPSPQ